MQTSWIFIASWLSRLILVILIGLSIWSIAVILNRKKFFSQMGIEENFRKLQKNLQENGLSGLLKSLQETKNVYGAAFAQLLAIKDSEKLEKGLNAYVLRERTDWETGLPILGTLGAITPFIGLLGTILGIIVAFGELSTGNMDSLKVMYALAEALILTAVGLGVAIPAVIANNFFNRKILVLIRNIESLKDSITAFNRE